MKKVSYWHALKYLLSPIIVWIHHSMNHSAILKQHITGSIYIYIPEEWQTWYFTVLWMTDDAGISRSKKYTGVIKMSFKWSLKSNQLVNFILWLFCAWDNRRKNRHHFRSSSMIVLSWHACTGGHNLFLILCLKTGGFLGLPGSFCIYFCKPMPV